MQPTLTRRAALALAAGSGVLAVAPRAFPRQTAPAPQRADYLPRQDPALVKDTVGKSHRSLEAVTELLKSHPELAKAAVDWGFGDWETALGAASHTGQREIALLLMQHGARPDIFTFAMLGRTAVVRAMIESQPGVQRILGPHGISLADHARAGGDEAAETLAYLESLGDADTGHTAVDLPDSLRDACVGRYQTSHGLDAEVTFDRGMLRYSQSDWSPLNLWYQGSNEFHPSGAPTVRFKFVIDQQRAAAFTVADTGELFRASRA